MTKEQILEILQHPEVSRYELSCKFTSPEQEASIAKFRKSLDEDDLTHGLYLSSGLCFGKSERVETEWSEDGMACTRLITNYMPVEYKFPDYYTEHERTKCARHKYVSIMKKTNVKRNDTPSYSYYDDGPEYVQWCSDPEMGGCYL